MSHFVWLGLVWLIQAAIAPLQAAEYPTTNELAYLGRQSGASPATPVSGTTNVEWFGGGLPWWQWSRLTGDGGSVRPALEAKGLTFAGTFTTDTSVGLNHGTHQRGVQRGLLNLNLTFDPEPILGISGGTFFAQYYYRYGRCGSADIGDVQGYDNLDTGQLNQVEEIWYEQKLVQGRLRLKAGQVDANSEFDNVPAASGFINSSAGYSPTLLNFSTYPKPALSVNAFAYPTKWLYGGGGIYTDNLRGLSNPGFQHPYLIGEFGLTHAGNSRLGPGQLAAGFWHDTAEQDRLDDGSQNGTSGWYALASQQVWQPRPAETDDGRGVSVFAQYGSSNPGVSPVARHVGTGVSATGLLPARKYDGLGIYWSWAGLSRARGSGFTHNESALEGYYQCQVTPFFTLKPDLQWIRHPGGQSSPGAVWVATLRIVIDL